MSLVRRSIVSQLSDHHNRSFPASVEILRDLWLRPSHRTRTGTPRRWSGSARNRDKCIHRTLRSIHHPRSAHRHPRQSRRSSALTRSSCQLLRLQSLPFRSSLGLARDDAGRTHHAVTVSGGSAALQPGPFSKCVSQRISDFITWRESRAISGRLPVPSGDAAASFHGQSLALVSFGTSRPARLRLSVK